MPKIILIVFLMLGSVIFMAAAAFFIKVNTNDQITIAVPRQPAFALIFVADKQGFFWKEGLSVSYRTHLLGKDALQEVSNDAADVAAVFDIPVINKLYEGEQLNVLTTLHSSTANHVIAAFKESGITQAADLRAKRVAINKGSSTEFFLALYLEENGMTESDVVIVNVLPNQLVTALETGVADAAVLFSPYTTRFTDLHPPEEIVLLQNDSYIETSLLIAKTDYVKTNPTSLKKLFKALAQADEYIRSHPEESLSYVHKWLPEMTRADLQSSWNTFNYSMKLSNNMLMNLERESQFIKNTRPYTSEWPNIRSTIISDYLEAVLPERVTIY